jgi:hypothetical protein
MSTGSDNFAIVFAGWLEALRRGDREAMRERLAPDVRWRGVRADLVCSNRDEVVEAAFSPDELPGVEAIAMRVLDDLRILLGIVSPDLVEIAGEPLDGQIWEVFTLRDGLIVDIDEHKTRAEAVASL